MRSMIAPLVAMALLAAFPAVAEKDEIRIAERWSEANPDWASYSKLIVVGISENAEARKQFEYKFVSHLKGAGVDAVSSREVVPDLAGELDRARILAYIEEQGIDGAITVRVVPITDGEEAWADAWRSWTETDQPMRELISETLPLASEKAGKYGVEAALWRGGDWKKIWAGRTDSWSRKKLRKNAGVFVQSAMNSMNNQRLLGK